MKTRNINRNSLLIITALFLIIGLFNTINTSHAQLPSNVYVTTYGDDSSNGNETNPFRTIGWAIDHVEDQGTVHIGSGIFNNNTDAAHKDYNKTIDKNVTLQGSGRDQTIIDAENQAIGFKILNGNTVYFNNLTIRNATAGFAQGGAIYNSGTLVVDGCRILQSTAQLGGGILNEGNLTLTNSQLIANHGTWSGGGVANTAGTLQVDNCQFNSNFAGSGAYGGAIYIQNGDVTITNSQFNGNHADVAGGAIYVSSGSATLSLTNCDFQDNYAASALPDSKTGGALYIENAIINDCRFTDNYVGTAGSGGAIYSKGTTLIFDSDFNNNRIQGGGTNGGNGGAIYNSGDLNITRSTFTNNTAQTGSLTGGLGGAIYNIGNLQVNNTTFNNNTAQGGATASGGNGGAIYNSGNSTITGTNFNNNVAGPSNGASSGRGGAICNYQSGALLNISQSTFTSNTAQAGPNSQGRGGAIYNYFGKVTISKTEFNTNIAENSSENGGMGGAIYSFGELTVTGSKFIGNIAKAGNAASAGSGGAIFVSSQTLTVTGSTFLSNSALAGGAIYLFTNQVFSNTVNYCRIIGNTATNGQDINVGGGNLDARYNWWGSNSGPAAGRVVGTDNYVPWLILSISANPTTIYTGQNSTITADLYTDSSDGNHQANSALYPPDIPATFISSLGEIGSHTIDVLLIYGTRTITLRGNEGSGPSDIQVIVDFFPRTASVNILASPTANAATTSTLSKTVGMQSTGMPMAGLILALLLIFSGLISQRK